MERVDPGGGCTLRVLKIGLPYRQTWGAWLFQVWIVYLNPRQYNQYNIHVNSIKKETQYNFAKPTSRDIRREEDLSKQSLSSPRSPTEGGGGSSLTCRLLITMSKVKLRVVANIEIKILTQNVLDTGYRAYQYKNKTDNFEVKIEQTNHRA